MRTAVYVDGFNLYYGALKNTSYKWLNLQTLCQLMLPDAQITKIKYFTAKVKPTEQDQNTNVRQQLYLRALRTIPNLEIHYGHFSFKNVRMPLATDPTQRVEVLKIEEKGSDVNLATHLLNDAHLGHFELGIVISNDSDLVMPVRIVKQQLKKKIGILKPSPERGYHLNKYANFHLPITAEHLINAQFPDQITDQKGTFHKPTRWQPQPIETG